MNNNKTILNKALNIMLNKNVDLVDALICSKNKLQGYGELSFDRDVSSC